MEPDLTVIPVDMLDGLLGEGLVEFCCAPPDDSDVDYFECPRCRTPWYRRVIADMEPVRRPVVICALDEPTTAWSTTP